MEHCIQIEGLILGVQWEGQRERDRGRDKDKDRKRENFLPPWLKCFHSSAII